MLVVIVSRWNKVKCVITGQCTHNDTLLCSTSLVLVLDCECSFLGSVIAKILRFENLMGLTSYFLFHGQDKLICLQVIVSHLVAINLVLIFFLFICTGMGMNERKVRKPHDYNQTTKETIKQATIAIFDPRYRE